MSFRELLAACVARNDSLLCVGLDPDGQKLPVHLSGPDTLFDFNKAIIDATADLVCAFKPNSAFYEANGADGIKQLKKTCEYIRKATPAVPIILDFKRGDIGNTNSAYAKFAFEYLDVDAVTLQPYQGGEALQAFLEYQDKGNFILAKTSNNGSGEFQDLKVGDEELYKVVARRVSGTWNKFNNCFLVVGATYPTQLKEVRGIVGDDMHILVPGVGSQKGELSKTLAAGLNSKGEGLIINASRSIIFASSGEDFAEAARAEADKLRTEINKLREA